MAYKKMRRQESEIVSDDEILTNPEDNVAMASDFSQSRGRGKAGKIIAIVILIAVVLAVGWYLINKYTSFKLPWSSQTAAVSGDWQGVFLDNGQVYFGKIQKITKDNLLLKDIYYLQVVTKPLQTTQQAQTASTDQQELTLIKLGNELHGPTDEMIINRDHVLLTEKLKNDSRVVQAIDNYLTQQAQPKK